MFYMSRRQALAILGDDAVLAVDPRRIDFMIDLSYRLYGRMLPAIMQVQNMGKAGRFSAAMAGKISYAFEPFLLSSARFDARQPVGQGAKYRLVSDFAAHRQRPQDSLWFAQLSEALRDHGMARHKDIVMRSEAEIMDFLKNYVGGLFDSMEREGYIPGRAADTGTAIIGPDGRIVKAAAGSHRFAAARLLGVAPIPLLILGVDAGWARSVGADRDPAALIAAIRQVGQAHSADTGPVYSSQ